MQPLLAITGILTRASEAKEKTEEAQEKEGLELAVTSSQMEDVNTLEITEEKLSNAIKQQFGNDKDFSITDNRDGSFLVSMNDTQRMYYIDETGEIIDQSKMLKISTADELKAFRDDVNSGNTYEGWYVYLANDITLDINEEWDSIGFRPNDSSMNDENVLIPFKGIFDGRNHEIDCIYINSQNKFKGLFGLVMEGKILNLGIGANSTINGTRVGGIVGYLFKSNLYNCYNQSKVTALGDICGGLIGQAEYSNISNCYNAGNIISSYRYIGGIAGAVVNNSTISDCYNSSSISSQGNETGGIVGTLNGSNTVDKCFNKGIISGRYFVGGIVGRSFTSEEYITNCYNNNNIVGHQSVGGIVGNFANIANCYNVGLISGNNQYQGAIYGETIPEGYEVINNFYLETCIDNNYQTIIEGIVESISSNELKLAFETLGTAYKEDTNNINNGYPILQWQ